MKNKEENDRIYQNIMRFRKQDPKRYGLTLIAVEYEDMVNYSRSEKKDSEELKWRISNLSKKVSRVMNIYKITIVEITEYFRFHNYSLEYII